MKTEKQKRKISKKDEIKWINTEGGNSKFREKVVKVNEKYGVNLVVLEPGCFDWGVKRVGCKKDGYRVVYDYMKTAEALAEDYLKWNQNPENENIIEGYDFDAAFLDACEWIDYNTIRSLPYAGSYAPVVVYTDENGKEQEA